MHNIMAARSRDRPPMLAIGRYAQWRSCFLRYIDTRPNGDALRKCILEGPYTPSTVIILAVPATENSPAVPEPITIETTLNTSPENKAHFESEKEAIHLILTGIGDEIYSAECRKPKKVKDFTYHKEKMLLCKKVKKGVHLQAEQSDWLVYTNEEIDEQELEAHYSYMEKIQEVPTADSGTDSEPLEQVQYDAGYNVFTNETQHSEQPESLSNTCVVKTGDSNVIPDSQDMCYNDIHNNQNAVECDDEQTSKTLGESNSIRDSCIVALQNKQTEFEKYKTLNDRTVDYDKLEHKLNETLGLLAQKDIDIKDGLKLKAYKILVVKEKHDELVKQILLTKSYYEGLVKEKTKIIIDLKHKEEKDIDKMISMEKPTFANPMYLKKAQSDKPCLYEIPNDQSGPSNRLVLDKEETLTLERERVIHKTINRPQLRSTQMKDKVVPNNSQVKDKKTDVEEHLRISSISNKTKGIEFLNKPLHAFFKEEGIEYQTSTPQIPEQNGIIKRQNRTLVEAARTMLSASKLPLFFWVEAIATACYTLNRQETFN
nr:putative ribonuclease H-like domain-containing protein [Tanacetum cinerariifolium]